VIGKAKMRLIMSYGLSGYITDVFFDTSLSNDEETSYMMLKEKKYYLL